jgi:two-component system NarL family sensor kinase
MRTVVEGVDGADKLCDDLDDLIEESLKEIRTFTYLLHPPSLDSDGFRSTIGRFAEGFAHRTGLNIDVEIAQEFDALPFDLQRSLLRVIQEAFANVFRHASATLITLRMSLGVSLLDMEINDDGRGMGDVLSDDAKELPFGVGIPGMRARLRQYDGNLDISTGPRGTTIRATIPNPPVPHSAIAEVTPAQMCQLN